MITKNSTSRAVIVHSVPNFDALHVEHHREHLRLLIAEGYCHLVLDLELTLHVNSSALGMMVELYQACRKAGGSFRLTNPSEEIQWLLRQTHLDKLLLGDAPTDGTGPNAPRIDALHGAMADEILLLSRISAIAERALKLDEPVEIGKTTLEGLAGALHSTRAVLFFSTQRGERLELAHWIGDQAPANTDFPLKIGSLEHSLLFAGQVASFEFMEHEPDPARRLLHGLGFRRLVAAPIAGRLRPYGLLCLEVDQELERLHLARPMLSALTQICGLALEKCALFNQVNLQKDELSDALQRLRASDHALRDTARLAAMGSVISGLGHQLNNKLVPLIGYLQMLQQERQDNPTASKLGVMEEACAEIQVIVQKMAHIGGARALKREPIDPAACLRVALTLFAAQIAQNRIRIESDADASAEIRFQGDSDLFLQAIIAVLHRSIASFPENQIDRRLAIRVEAIEGALEIAFEDNGLPPLDTDLEDQIDPLLPFEQLHAGMIFNYTIPRGILRRHQGMLEVMQAGETGKRVRITLPLARAQA